MRASLGASLLLGLTSLFAVGCNNTPTPGADTGPGTDGGGGNDAGVTLTCPTGGMIPAGEQTLPCCYRASQAGHETMPELRLRYLHINAPRGSALATNVVNDLLNGSLRDETFNWLIRGMSGAGDGAVTITTGFGRRDATSGSYAFSTDPAYLPVTLDGTISGEVVTTMPDDGVLTIPVFDPTGTVLQVELPLHNVRVITSTFTENRSCIGALAVRGTFTTAATLSGFLTVADTRDTMIDVNPIHSPLCPLVASLNLNAPTYCDMPQAMWAVMPDSLCPASGQCMLDDGSGSVCSHDGTGATPCNAWQLVSDFAAVGVEISP